MSSVLVIGTVALDTILTPTGEAPMVLGGGTPLFRAGTRQMYRQTEVRPSRNAVHLSYERVERA